MNDLLAPHGVLKPLLAGLLHGVSVTLLTSTCAFFIGLGLGVVLMVLRVAGGAFFRCVIVVYVSAIRGIPLLVQLLVVYYVLPPLVGMNISPLAAGVATLALNTAAYASEILRGALSTLPTGQAAAARALGMSAGQVWRCILLPQIFHRSIPPLTNEYTVLLKASSLLSVIAVAELATVARNATLQTDLPLQVFSATAATYFVLLWIASSISRRIERRFSQLLPHAH